jgi:hypothetical protein
MRRPSFVVCFVSAATASRTNSRLTSTQHELELEMGYRPICDFWWLARAKLKPHADGTPRRYYGAYLGGFPERARVVLGASVNDPVLHVCGGMARFYPYAGGFGRYDRTLDLAPETEPDYLQDARDPFPIADSLNWRAMLIDPPYTRVDAREYSPGEENYPEPNVLVRNALNALPVGGRVGLIHYVIPAQPCLSTPRCESGKCRCVKFVFVAAVGCGFNNRIRAFSVFEKLRE